MSRVEHVDRVERVSYNPDVLSCLANLSNDEVFTPPAVVNQMLDLLPQELFASPKTKFLDPATKSGVFLREITKRLIKGLENEIPDLRARVDHILQNQVFGIATTELTSLVARRSLYCSKYPNCKYSVSKFDTVEGNIRFRSLKHTFVNGRCKWCGASASQFDRDASLESHAYEFIHTSNPEEIFNMKFDVIISNPPYQMNTGGSKSQAVPIYNLFVEQAIKMKPHYLVMIIPGRWYSGGMGLDEFRTIMLNNHHVKVLVDYPNAEECFSGVEIRGGVCYFLWDREYSGECLVSNIVGGGKNEMRRHLDEFPVFVRWNSGLRIIQRITSLKEDPMSMIVSSVSPFGLATSYCGEDTKFNGAITLYSSKGISYLNEKAIDLRNPYLRKYKVMFTRPISGNMETPPFKVIALLDVLKPYEVCTHTYLVAGCFDNKRMAENLRSYLRTKFARFLLALSISGMDISREKFRFVPLQDFSKPWTDEELYKKYKLTDEEIEFIESMIKPME